VFEQAFKNIDDVLWKDAGCGSELDYIEQTSWALFLKYLDDLEKDKKTEAELAGKRYKSIIDDEFKWNAWASPKDEKGNLDRHKALVGDDLKDFVDHKLFPYLKKFKTSAEHSSTFEYKIGEIFSELKNKIQSGYNLREVIDHIDGLRFRSKDEKHELSHLYESKIKNMGNAGRNGGEYYTPRPLIKTIVKVVAPIIGNKIYDGAAGSAGFLAEAYEYLRQSKNLSTKDAVALQKSTFYGKEKKSLGELLFEQGVISQIQWSEVKDEEKRTGDSVRRVLLKLGIISEEDLVNFISEQMNIPRIELDNYLIDSKVIDLLPESLARKHQLIPILKIGNSLTCAMVDVFNIYALDEVSMKTNLNIEPAVATEGEIQKALDEHYSAKGSMSDVIFLNEPLPIVFTISVAAFRVKLRI